MYDFSKQVRKFHEDHVRLTSGEQSDMRSRRERNLKRIQDGLAELDKPNVAETINQGGYAQRTMTQPPENDADSRYDIDLGIVFEQDEAKTPRTTRDWVRQAIARKGSGFKNEPVTKKKCVRVVYSNGYQCDFPGLGGLPRGEQVVQRGRNGAFPGGIVLHIGHERRSLFWLLIRWTVRGGRAVHTLQAQVCRDAGVT